MSYTSKVMESNSDRAAPSGGGRAVGERADDAIESIERSFIALVRRSLDPRLNRYVNALAGNDLERAEVTLLIRVARFEPVRLSTLADEVGLDISTVSRQVARLVEAGLVERRTDPADGRAALLELSAAGRSLHDRIRHARREWMTELLADFEPTERVDLARLLERFIDAMHRFDQERADRGARG